MLKSKQRKMLNPKKKHAEIQAKKDFLNRFCNSTFNRTVRLIESTEYGP